MSFTNKNLVIFALLSSFLSSEIYDFKEINLSDEKMNLSKEIFRKLERNHFLKKKYLVDFNQNYIESLIDKLDENKMYFTEDEVFNFINSSNSEIKVNYDLELAYKIINLYFSRIVEYSNYQINLINRIEFDFEKKDFMDIYYEDNLWPIDKKSLKEIWKLSTKNDLLVLKLTEEASLDPKKDLVKRYNNRIKRISQQKEEDIFSLAINILTNQFDPHSSYLSPRSAEDFDMDMSLSLEGIGALLGTDDDYTRIVSLVPGGPAEKSGKISP
ncbi:MAG: peptidase, partial [Flavobacteriaceae bacterium]|nr:peptidase [Flavobacteriaceae bacterium]